VVLADKGYDPDSIHKLSQEQGATANIPPKKTLPLKSCSARGSTASAT
jgi:hypothetical protein